MRASTLLVKNGNYYFIPQYLNELGSTSPMGPFIGGSALSMALPQEIGKDALLALNNFSSIQNDEFWNDPAALNNLCKNIGFMTYDDFINSAKFIYIEEIEKEKINVYPSEYKGGLDFKFLPPLHINLFDKNSIGNILITAINLSK